MTTICDRKAYCDCCQLYFSDLQSNHRGACSPDTSQLLIDERLGRLEAKRQGLRITGILGILLAAKNQQLIVEVRPLLSGQATPVIVVSPTAI